MTNIEVQLKIDQIIKARKTQKVLTAEPWPIPTYREAFAQTIRELLELAAHAPYHKKCHESHTQGQNLTSCVPWRFYVIDSVNCRQVLTHMEAEQIKGGKINQMLAAADALLMVTWLPEPSEAGLPPDPKEEPLPFTGDTRNMEHIAATAAAIQNVLLGATARGIPSYWSSGGVLRNAELRTFLGVPLTEILLGAVFLFPKEYDQGKAEVVGGKLRDQGKEQEGWARWVEV